MYASTNLFLQLDFLVWIPAMCAPLPTSHENCALCCVCYQSQKWPITWRVFLLQESATDTAALFILIIDLYIIPLAAVPWCSQNVPILLCQQSARLVDCSHLKCVLVKMTASRSCQGCWGQPHLLLWDQICAASNISGHFLSSSVLFLQSSCSRINPDTEQRSSEETKLASYATPSSERGSITRGLILRVTKERKNDETRTKTKTTGGHIEVKAFAFIDCSSSGRLAAAAEVELNWKELKSFGLSQDFEFLRCAGLRFT